MCYVYIVRCADGSFYTGWTMDIERRIAEHNSGRGAKYTKTRRPVKLVYIQSCASKSDALKREIEIKMLTRLQKSVLIENFQKNN